MNRTQHAKTTARLKIALDFMETRHKEMTAVEIDTASFLSHLLDNRLHEYSVKFGQDNISDWFEFYKDIKAGKLK